MPKSPKTKDPFVPLTAAWNRLDAAERKRDEAREDFYLAVRKAKAAGLTLQQIGDVCGLTRARISQIVLGE